MLRCFTVSHGSPLVGWLPDRAFDQIDQSLTFLEQFEQFSQRGSLQGLPWESLGKQWENHGTTVFFAGKNMGKPSIFRLISKAMCETYILGIMGIKLYTVTKNILDNLGDSCIDGWWCIIEEPKLGNHLDHKMTTRSSLTSLTPSQFGDQTSWAAGHGSPHLVHLHAITAAALCQQVGDSSTVPPVVSYRH